MGSRLDANSDAMRKRPDIDDFHDETGEEYEASSFGGFGDYMRRKKMKLQNLDAEIRATSGECPQIFRGIVAHVNGYTQPSLQDLHRLIVSHGGGFLQYLDGKTAATHIIASALTPKKCEEFRRYRIVKPAWITESIKAGRLLPWNDFRVVDEGQSQKVLKFGGGRITSQTNTPRSGYKDQSSTSWYNNQLQAMGPIARERGTEDHETPSKPGPATPTLPLQSPRSHKRSSSSSSIPKETKPSPSATPSSSQSYYMKTPSKVTAFSNEDLDQLESPHKNESGRIQVDPVLSNSTHKPLNLSGSQFILPAEPEQKAAPSVPTDDIRKKLTAQGKLENFRSGSPCPPPRQTQAPYQEWKSGSSSLPHHPELDPETLAALPEDIRNEVLAHYNNMPRESTSDTPPAPPAHSSTSARPSPAGSAGIKRPASPIRKPIRPIKSGKGSTRTLMQLGFVSQPSGSSTPTINSTSKQQSSPTPAPPAHLPVSVPAATEKTSQPGTGDSGKDTPSNNSNPTNRASFTSKALSNIDDLRDSISAWHTAFLDDAPYKDDVQALCIYLGRVTTEEKDVDKAVSVVRWLMWLVDQNAQKQGDQTEVQLENDVVTWAQAIDIMQESIQSALKARDLPVVSFD
ncbi:DNA repair protein Rev1 [Penicillium angulare]|uniref:DNA repair protein Rev1 n=1 Tax=Penicillium angulare TaxID=116970 RepID=UPI002540DFCE|nr:DNA repair protein Rev1 [Penicillium angulare]KAJ5272675.1 DNA repair protein Rev1 [Penicillium angulare]